jgi:NADH-quinone oxidoreductase subunit K
MNVGLTHFLVLSVVLFSLGLLAVMTRRNAIMILMGVELILNSANINFLAFARFQSMNLNGHVASIFVIMLAAAEAAVALAIVLNVFKKFSTVETDRVSRLKE